MTPTPDPTGASPKPTQPRGDDPLVMPSAVAPDVSHAISVLERIRQGEHVSDQELRKVELTLLDQGAALDSALIMARQALHRTRNGDCSS